VSRKKLARPSPRPLPRAFAAPVAEPKRRSHAAAPVAVAILFAGLLLGTVTILLPALLGFFLFLAGLSFLSTRMNPFSIGFYLTTKPSWTAIGVIFLSALLLWVVAYAYLVHGIGPLVPGHH
jgi:hypothetical protein